MGKILTRTPNQPTYGAVRGADYVIAASNASAIWKAQANYVMSSGEDIGAKATAVMAGLDSSYGGVLLCSPGLFNQATPVYYPDLNFITLKGCGPSSTTFQLGANANCVMVARATPGTTRYRNRIKGIGLDGNKANNATGTYGIDATGMESLVVSDARIYDTKSHGLYNDSTAGVNLTRVKAVSCGGYGYYVYRSAGWLLANVSTSSCAGGGIYFREAYECSATNLGLDQDSGSHSLYIGGSQRIHVTNFFAAPMTQYMAGVFFTNSQDCGVYNGSIYSPAGAAADTVGIYFYASNGNTVDGCVADGITVDGGLAATVRGWRETADGTGTIKNCKLTNCTFRDLTAVRHASSNTRSVWCMGNQGYIAPGERRSYANALTPAASGAVGFYWNNPEKQDILIKEVLTDITTASTDPTAAMSIGIDDSSSGTNAGTEFSEGIPTDATGIHVTDAAILCEDSTNATDAYVVGIYVTEDSTKLAGSYHITYVGR